ncbi:hypothetical protein HYDPIDRAFT_169973 [Hydnomerulius pinastri MD-312]|uniref:Uncharacterized protein n=1 Tax=Hydnomerulius pinastri MD-312 TaxID=994086 RepID=A0A0C9W3T6_9AGAM|nr:hypothetical protein HYDPIDRAFT_169973 [Hydnomerulius pinastri MD-312]
MAQKAYTGVCSELHSVRKELMTLSSAIPACKCSHMLNKSDSLNASIANAAKRYIMLYHFWVLKRLFPPTPKPNVDPQSSLHWASPQAKLSGSMAELYSVIPKALHDPMENYKQSSVVFCSALGQERSNILKTIKDSAGIIFAPFKLDPTLFGNQTACKKENMQFLGLLKKGGASEYTHMAPILFANPERMVPDEFFKSPILILHVIIFGKSFLSEKRHGRPKTRDQRMGIVSTTEGLIAGSAILAHFLLMHNPELSATGAETGIPYQLDYDFYLDPQPHTWEDKFLEELENPSSAQSPPSPVSNSVNPFVASPPHSPTPPFDINMTTHSTSSVSVGHGNSVAFLSVSQLQLEVSQMSLQRTLPPVVKGNQLWS